MTGPVRIPADVDIPDRVLGRLTARQVVILTLAAGLVYGGWWAGHVLAPGLPPLVYVVVAVPLLAVAVALAFGRRDGIHAEVFARAAIRYRLRARHLHTGPCPHPGRHTERRAGRGSGGVGAPGWASGRARPAPGHPRAPRDAELRLPARAITTSPATGAAGEVGLIDLGSHGWAVIAAVGTVAVGLRGPEEQQALIGYFAHWLHALNAPAQILVRAQHLDLGPALDDLATATATVRHPALAAAAAGHHDWLAALATQRGPQLLTHQVLIVLREPAHTGTGARGSHPGHSVRTRHAGRRGASGAAARLAHRLLELDRALAPAEITVTPLDPDTAAAVLATTADPARPATAHTPPDTGPRYQPRPDHDHEDIRRWAA